MSFGDVDTATRTRDAFERLAIRVLDRERPPYKYGTVTAIAPDGKTVSVQFAGDITSVPVKVLGIRPSAVGQVVQVAGRLGDRFVAGVVGDAVAVETTPASSLTAPAGFTLTPGYEALYADWDAVTGSSKYEIQFADDAAFTVNARSFFTISTSFTHANIPSGTDTWARVRAVNSNGAGTWATTGPVQPFGFDYGNTDGSPPASSPTPVLTPGIGYLFAVWLPVSNVDLVVYEVHISTSSGFTPSAATLVGETTATFTSIRVDGSGAPLAYDTTYFVRLIAKDGDGAAAVGAQDSAQIDKIELGDVGNVTSSDLTDGAVPSTSPAVGGIHNGVGFLYVQWGHIANNDQVTYEVHISTTTGFTPDANSYVGETVSNWFFIRTQGAGAAYAPLVYGTTYYVKLWAKDLDGYAAAPGTQGSGFTVKVNTADIEVDAVDETVIADDSISTPKLQANAVTAAKILAQTITANEIATGTITADRMVVGTITAASGIIADAAIGTAKIQDLAVTNGKIANLAVDTAKIANLAVGTAQINDLAVTAAKIANLTVGTAQIADLAVTTAKITDLAVTDAKINTLSASKITAGTINTGTINVASTISLSGSGILTTATSGARVELTQSAKDRIKFYNSAGTNLASLGIGIGVGSTYDTKLTVNGGFGVYGGDVYLGDATGFNTFKLDTTLVELRSSDSTPITIATGAQINISAGAGSGDYIILDQGAGNGIYINRPGNYVRIMGLPFTCDSTIQSGGHVFPGSSAVYNCGTSTQKWKELWLSETAFIGEGRITRYQLNSLLVAANSSDLAYLLLDRTGSADWSMLEANDEVGSVTVYNHTHTGQAGIQIASNGTIRRSSSSIKYKKDVETLEMQYAERVLDLRPVWFRPNDKQEIPDKDDWGFYGLIAEEVAEVDPRLAVWGVDYEREPHPALSENAPHRMRPKRDKDGRCVPKRDKDGKAIMSPEDVQYDKIVPALLLLVKDLRSRVEELESVA